MEAEDIGLNKPTVKDKLKAGVLNAMNKGYLDTAKMLRDQLDANSPRERAKAESRKEHKRAVAASRRAMNALHKERYDQRDPRSSPRGY